MNVFVLWIEALLIYLQLLINIFIHVVGSNPSIKVQWRPVVLSLLYKWRWSTATASCSWTVRFYTDPLLLLPLFLFFFSLTCLSLVPSSLLFYFTLFILFLSPSVIQEIGVITRKKRFGSQEHQTCDPLKWRPPTRRALIATLTLGHGERLTEIWKLNMTDLPRGHPYLQPSHPNKLYRQFLWMHDTNNDNVVSKR